MKATDYFRKKVKSGEMTADEALVEVLELFENSNKFIDSLIDKYETQKKTAFNNVQIFKKSEKFEWYDATYTNTNLFIWDLNDIKCRSGMSEE